MPARKKPTTTRSFRTARNSREQNTATPRTQATGYHEELSYETKLIIVILLLLFVYPLGVIFMWLWMREWPVWLKIVISLPIILGIIGIFVGIFFLSLLLRNAALNRNFQNQMMRQYEQQYKRQYRMMPVPSETITPSEEATPLPSDTGTGTY